MEDEKLNKIINLLEDDILHHPSSISNEYTLKSLNALSSLILAKTVSASIAEETNRTESAPIEPVQMLRC